MFSYKIFWCAPKLFQAHGVDTTIFAFVCDQKNEIPDTGVDLSSLSVECHDNHATSIGASVWKHYTSYTLKN